MIFREGSGVAALACCRAATDSLLLLTNFLCHNVKDFKGFGEKKEKKKQSTTKKLAPRGKEIEVVKVIA